MGQDPVEASDFVQDAADVDERAAAAERLLPARSRTPTSRERVPPHRQLKVNDSSAAVRPNPPIATAYPRTVGAAAGDDVEVLSQLRLKR
ncbi:hypothetical protein ACFWFI_04460 [Streptomyces sp. NPDC060209]|uniref:hypothetical protein n=1 Tax=Streptomyces sp. NPDC060209 TaxID=3347073 RepID=UPI0036618758